MKAITDAWVALEDMEDEDGEDEETDVESDGEAVEEVHELFQANSVRERKLFKLTCEEDQHWFEN